MAIVNLDKVKSDHVESVKHTAQLLNGYALHVGGLATGEDEIKDAVVPDTTTYEDQPIVLHATPEVDPDPQKSGLGDFAVAAGDPARAIYLEVGDEAQLTDDLFTAAPTVGDYVVPDGNGTMKFAPSVDGTQTIGSGTSATTYTPRFRAKVLAQTSLHGNTAYLIKVEQA